MIDNASGWNLALIVVACILTGTYLSRYTASHRDDISQSINHVFIFSEMLTANKHAG